MLYHPAHDGKAVIYTRSFESLRAFFRGERRLFANRRARNEHRGIIFPNFRAWWNGTMSFRELLFGANSKSSIDVEAVAAAEALKKRTEKAAQPYAEQENAQAAAQANLPNENGADADQNIPIEPLPQNLLDLLGGAGKAGDNNTDNVPDNNHPPLFSSPAGADQKKNLERHEEPTNSPQINNVAFPAKKGINL